MPLGWLALAVPLGLLVTLAVIASWRRPALGLGIFALGLAFHNAVIMVLLDAGTPSLVVRGLQAWKELVLLVLVLKIGSEAWHGWEGGLPALRSRVTAGAWPLRVLDGIAIAFTLLLLVYLAASFLWSFGAETTIAQRLLSFRIFILIPVLYALGRLFGARDPVGSRLSVNLVVIAAATVAVIGLIELWFVRTRLWLDFGVTSFTALQGFEYRGPGGLPENFFQGSNAGYALRRMVSTYISPLGIAYTALLVVPLIVGVLVAMRRPRHWAWLALALVLASIALSVTRLALLCLVFEALVWIVVTRRPVAALAGVLSLTAVGLAFSIYPLVGPLVNFDLTDVRLPAGAVLVAAATGVDIGDLHASGSSELIEPDIVGSIVTQQDASIQNHILQVRNGLVHAVDHPLGVGLGSTMPRFGTATGPAESALLGIVGEIGLLGGALFVALYCGVLLVGLIGASRQLDRPFLELALLVGVGGIGLAPIVMTSAVWSDLSVTFLFWWAAGVTASVAGRNIGIRRSPGEALPSGDSRP
jgi:hypothetical protein